MGDLTITINREVLLTTEIGQSTHKNITTIPTYPGATPPEAVVGAAPSRMLALNICMCTLLRNDHLLITIMDCHCGYYTGVCRNFAIKVLSIVVPYNYGKC